MKDLSPNNELLLLTKLKAGDQEALSTLYNIYSDQLIYYVQRAAKSPFLAEDIVHDTFLKIWQHRDQLDPTKPIRPYLFVIAKRTLLNLLKRANHEGQIISEMQKYAFEEDQSTQHLLAYNESSKLINEAIDNLSGQVKRTFICCRLQGMSYKQAAEMLQITESTVNKHMSKALHLIREYLKIRTGKTFLFIFIFYWMLIHYQLY
jgi:RNA polymerase sigma-70 factor (family 1)